MSPTTSHQTPTKSLRPLLKFLPHRENTLRDPPATTRRQVTDLIEVVSDLSVAPSTRPQRQYRTDKQFLIVTQRSNVERDRSAANDESLCGFSGGLLRSRSQQGHSTVTDFAKLRGLSTSVPRAHAV